MDQETREDVITASLLKAQFCTRCVLRFLGRSENINYEFRFYQEEDEYVVAAKKRKYGKTDELACRACCGILQDEFLEIDVLRNPKLKDALSYDVGTFLIYVNLPLAIVFRQHAVAFELKEQFPSFFTDQKIAQILPLNKAWTLSLHPALEEVIHKKYHKKSNFSIEFHVDYMANSLELEDLEVLRNTLKSKNRLDLKLSKCNADEFIKAVTPEVFRKHFKYPAPARPLGITHVSSITLKHEPVFMAGRYCKYSRFMGQTPWILDQVKIVEDSVQDNIFQVIENNFQADKMVFSASGREDFDVRTLGRGRPFYVRIINPKRVRISFEEFRRIEHDIRKCGVIEVRDLQFINKDLLNEFKEGEELKRKTYKALCVVYNREELQSCIEKINCISHHGPLTIQQTTPVRVFHRRTGDVRERNIYEIKAWHIDGADDMLELYLITQAGTYVKEFVHGDFGRTKPCLAEILQQKVDIIALDVLDIDLDFPPAVSFNYNEPSVNRDSDEEVAVQDPIEFWAQKARELNEHAVLDSLPNNCDVPLDFLPPGPHESETSSSSSDC